MIHFIYIKNSDFHVYYIDISLREDRIFLKIIEGGRKIMIDINNTTDSFYEKLFENSAGIQIIVDGENGQIINANKTACKFYGYSKEQIKKLKLSDISSINNLKAIEHSSNQTLESKNTELYSTQKLANGSTKDVKVIFSKIWIDGKIYFNVTISDALESRNTKEKRDKSKSLDASEELAIKVEERQRQMLERLPVAILLSCGIEERTLYQNPLFIDFFGHNFDDFYEVSEWWPIAYPDPEYREWVSKEWSSRLAEAVKNQSEIVPMEVDITTRDGSVKHICVHATVFGDMNFITFIDMTERKKAEEALRLANAYNRSLIESSLDALITIGPEGRIIDVNSTTEKATGYSREELIGTNILDYFTDHDKVKNAHNQVFKDGVIEDHELELKHKEGYATPVLCNGSFYKDECGHVKGVFIAARDITELKIREEKLEKEKSAAEEANVLKSQFLANMSHELRTPVNVIFSAIQLFELHLKKNSDVGSLNCNKHLQAMKQNCHRLLRLINNLIDITKIGAGFMELHLKNVNVVSIVEDITLSVEEYAKGKDIYVQFDTEIEEKIMALDPDKLERILLNLLSNAIKFTRKSGNIFVNLYDRDTSIIISVKDTGIGIPLDKISQIFERFIQVENTMIRSNEGSGIGLSIVKSFVEMQGGTINVLSEVGVGSEFLIQLPVNVLFEKCEQDFTVLKNKQNYAEVLDIEFSDIYK